MFAEVALRRLAIHDGTLLYEVPEKLRATLSPGMLVEIPYKDTRTTGIITSIHSTSPYKNTRSIIEIVNKTPLLTTLQLRWAYSIAEYYMTPINRVLSLFVPNKLWEVGWQPQYRIHYTLNNKKYSPSPRAKKEQEILGFFKGQTILTESQAKFEGFSKKHIQTLIEKNVLRKHVGKLTTSSPYLEATIPLSPLTTEQKEVFEKIIQQKATYLLHGITGSGKTQVYLHLAKYALENNNQICILVPEIALTGQIIMSFQKHFGEEVAVLHSHRTDKERAQEWTRIRRKEAHIIIGSRLALFAPIDEPTFLVIDEEHDWSYKSDQSPRYHATTAAHLLYAIHPYTIILGSATPSIESYYRAEQGTYLLLTLMQKYYQTSS